MIEGWEEEEELTESKMHIPSEQGCDNELDEGNPPRSS
jgi:hypothetical protein